MNCHPKRQTVLLRLAMSAPNVTVTRRGTRLPVTTTAACCLLAVLAALGAGCPAPREAGPTVNTTTDGDQTYPSVAMARLGNYVVVWRDYDAVTNTGDILAQRFSSSGRPRGPEFKVNQQPASPDAVPSVATDALGNFICVWESLPDDEDQVSILGRMYDAFGNPKGKEFRLNAHEEGRRTLPAVAMNARGAFAVTWFIYNLGSYLPHIDVRAFDSNGIPAGEESLTDWPYAHAGPGSPPSLGIDGAGNFLVAWEQSDGHRAGIRARRYDASGQAAGDVFQVNTETRGDQDKPAIAMNEAGDAVIAWRYAISASGYGPIRAQRYDTSGAPLGEEFDVVSIGSWPMTDPCVALDHAGNLAVAWQAVRGGLGYLIYARTFDANGEPTAPEFTLESEGIDPETTSNQRFPAIAANATGRFAIAWQDWRPDDSSWDIYADLFSLETTK